MSNLTTHSNLPSPQYIPHLEYIPTLIKPQVSGATFNIGMAIAIMQWVSALKCIIPRASNTPLSRVSSSFEINPPGLHSRQLWQQRRDCAWKSLVRLTYFRWRVNFPLICPSPEHPWVGQLQNTTCIRF